MIYTRVDYETGDVLARGTPAEVLDVQPDRVALVLEGDLSDDQAASAWRQTLALTLESPKLGSIVRVEPGSNPEADPAFDGRLVRYEDNGEIAVVTRDRIGRHGHMGVRFVKRDRIRHK